jgi:hypothetical protein
MLNLEKRRSFGVPSGLLSALSLIAALAACSSDSGGAPAEQQPGAGGSGNGGTSQAGTGGSMSQAGSSVAGSSSGSGGGENGGSSGTGGTISATDSGVEGGAMGGLVQPIQRGDTYVLEFGATKFIVAPNGARITTFSLDDTNILTGPNVNAMFWGSTLWTAPESDWMPPNIVANIDTAPYTMTVGADNIISAVGMTANVNNKMVAVSKRFMPDLATSTVNIEYTLTNKGTASFQIGHWEVTRVPPGGLTFYPAGTAMTAYGPLTLEKANGYYWFDHTKFPMGMIGKAGGDDVGSWVAHVMPDPKGDIVLIKVFPDIPPGSAPPGHSEIEIFAQADKSYVEIEAHNKYLTFMPGQAIPWTVRWYLRRLPIGTMRAVGSQALIDFVLQQMK